VRYVRADESPHVEYLRTALTEVRSRTLRTIDGSEIAGRAVVDGLLHRVLHTLTTERPREQRDDLRRSLTRVLEHARRPSEVRERFDALETKWTPPSRTGFEPIARSA